MPGLGGGVFEFCQFAHLEMYSMGNPYTCVFSTCLVSRSQCVNFVNDSRRPWNFVFGRLVEIYLLSSSHFQIFRGKKFKKMKKKIFFLKIFFFHFYELIMLLHRFGDDFSH